MIDFAIRLGSALIVWLLVAGLFFFLAAAVLRFAVHVAVFRAHLRRYPGAPRRSVWRFTK